MDAVLNKRSALAGLKFKRNNPSNKLATPSATPPSTSAPLPAADNNGPPPQSRDGAAPSRYFGPDKVSPAFGNILVPSSSPIAPSPLHNAHNASTSADDVAAGHHDGRPRPPSSIISAPSPPSLARSPSDSTGQRRPRDIAGAGEVGEEPPRKRINRGPLDDALSGASPESPAIRGPGHRRRMAPPGSPASSEESLVDPRKVLASNVPHAAPAREASSSSSTTPAPVDPAFTRFKITQPLHPEPLVRAAWMQGKQDVRAASYLLNDPQWIDKQNRPPPQARPAPTTAKPVSVTVSAKANKQSAIYSHRPPAKVLASPAVPSTSTPATKATPKPTPKPVADTSIEITSSPILPLPKKRKMVIEDSDESDFNDSDEEEDESVDEAEVRALSFFNDASPEDLQEMIGCTPVQADKIVELRPFDTVDVLTKKLNQGARRAGPAGLSPKVFSDTVAVYQGYGSFDTVLDSIEKIGDALKAVINSWALESDGHADSADTQDDGALNLQTFDASKAKDEHFIARQPPLVADNIQLKDYQLLGINWLNLMHRKQHGCILADEMGLGKTCQVISFLAHLKEQGNSGPHLIIVPSSTLENWCREFNRFAPTIQWVTYYDDQKTREQLRMDLRDDEGKPNDWEVMITTYDLACGNSKDSKFLRKFDWECFVCDEGHSLKNFKSRRYGELMKINPRWRLLLTGTPLQNNLQELASIMNFIIPEKIGPVLDKMRAIFKTTTTVTLLSQERITRAHRMVTPFVLRRKKKEVLKDLPDKHERVEWCEMVQSQQEIYSEAVRRSRKTVRQAEELAEVQEDDAKTKGKKKPATASKVTSAHVLMDLRKAASHPMLFRKRFTDDMLRPIAVQLMQDPWYAKRYKGNVGHLAEDCALWSDSELQHNCRSAASRKSAQFCQDDDCYMDSGKVQTLLRLLDQYIGEKRKVLIFSQFTQVLDILTAVLTLKKIAYRMLTGSTRVDERQDMVDEFNESDDITVFLLSTKAGGMGINLTSASVVILFDQDFNPHNDRQAQDRAYRIGQTRDVDVIKLITRGTIEEDMLRLAQTKLALDEAVAGDVDDEKGESAIAKEIKTSLLSMLRKQCSPEPSTSTTSSAPSPAVDTPPKERSGKEAERDKSEPEKKTMKRKDREDEEMVEEKVKPSRSTLSAAKRKRIVDDEDDEEERPATRPKATAPAVKEKEKEKNGSRSTTRSSPRKERQASSSQKPSPRTDRPNPPTRTTSARSSRR
ncbi:SNF2 family N-terminal domain-containing protein [Schizophyllum amplum]|uniref:DNA helicase n=1 Tax=Schizophyllum amplum TaxID=97359 RepID=A0A550CYP1_9AGAR|nr:SNF2 family N-terminal domain-containing protein [Auriculariopsis ampla]